MRLQPLVLAILITLSCSACGYLRIDPMHVLLRSDVITSEEQEREILSRAKVTWTDDKRIRVLYVSGTAYERGYQHGALLREEVRDNLLTMYDRSIEVFRSKELLAEAYERLRPYIPEEYIQEMHGLAHGAKLPLEVVHLIHALPSVSEWGGKSKIKETVKQMMSGELATSCSNISACGEATHDGGILTVRILDWGLHKISKLHEYPLITVGQGPGGHVYANIGWVGFLGAVSGMNAEGITLGEMGYGSPENETLRGKPMVFLLRDVLSYASNLAEARHILETAKGENSYVFLMSDGKTSEAELYVKDPDRFLVFKAGENIKDTTENIPGIEKVLYGGHYNELMTKLLTDNRGKLSPQMLMQDIIPQIAMKSNFQNVVYDPRSLMFWVSNAKSPTERAAEQPYSPYSLQQGLGFFEAGNK